MGVITKVHVLRHGEVHNPEGILYGRLPGYRLSDRGQAQAQAVADTLADNDIVAVNRALEAHHNSLVVAVVDNEFTCKRFSSVTAKCAWWQPIRRIQTFVQRTARPWKSGAWLLQH